MMTEKKIMRLTIPLVLIALLLCSCAPQEHRAPSGSINATEPDVKAEYIKISGIEAAEMMSGDVVIIDARTQEEYAAGHIPNAVLLPYDAITADTAAAAVPNKDQTILVYCRTGRRSEAAAKALIELGYTAVYDFGGISTDWNGDIAT